MLAWRSVRAGFFGKVSSDHYWHRPWNVLIFSSYCLKNLQNVLEDYESYRLSNGHSLELNHVRNPFLMEELLRGIFAEFGLSSLPWG